MSDVNPSHRPLRVVMVSRRVHPAHGPGGLERHVFELAQQLAGRGVEIDLYAEAPRDRARLARANHTLSSFLTPHWSPAGWLPIGSRTGTIVLDRITNYFIWSRRVSQQVMSREPAPRSIVHVHGLAGWGLARATKKGRLRAPLVVTTQGLEEFRSHLRLKRWAYLPFRRGMVTVAANSDAVVTTDRSLIPVIEQYLGVTERDQVIIPNAIDPERCRQLGKVDEGCAILGRHGREQAAPVFMSVGRLEANKGFRVLVTALAAAAPRLPPSWTWVLVGDGPERDTIRASIREAGLDAHCVLTGRVDEGDLHSLYTVADWFVHPTLYEGSSLATLEAMAHGLPVLATRAGGLPDKVEEGVSGFLVTAGNAEELSARLVQTSTVDGDEFGARGRERCEAEFSWTVVVPQYLSLYERLVAAAPPAC